MSTTSPIVPTVTTDVLVVGAGPAGASLASFLGYYGVKGMMISRDKSTAPQPRAHLTNAGAWECLRDIGLENEYRAVAMSKQHYGDFRFCYSLAGGEIGRTYSFTKHPDHIGEYLQASPCEHADVSQNVGEPILVKFAASHGFDVRFSCKLVGFSKDELTGLITSIVEDQVTNVEFQVVSKYLCGADGVNSLVARQAGLPFRVSPGGGTALNVWYEADLAHLYAVNPGLLHSIFDPAADPPLWGVLGMNRVVRPWTEFIMSIQAAPGVTSNDVSTEDILARLRQLIGDPDVKIKLKGVYRWKVNEAFAEVVSKDNIFCLGDAIHRHPPSNGLGSNTCIQDSYNLAWKLAYVLQGKAQPSLLDSYNAERQPVAKRIVGIANDSLRTFLSLCRTMGIREPTVEARLAAVQLFKEATPEGKARRAEFKRAREAAMDDTTGLGAEMNQAYVSDAIFLDDEPNSGPSWGEESDAIRHHVVSTYPGSRLPHAWLGTSKFGEKISTHDLAGKGEFTLFTGIGGKSAWTRAAEAAMKATQGGIKINVHSIGHGQDWQDMYLLWEDRRGVEDEGAVLVRPDRTVAWRSIGLDEATSETRLVEVVQKVLGFR